MGGQDTEMWLRQRKRLRISSCPVPTYSSTYFPFHVAIKALKFPAPTVESLKVLSKEQEMGRGPTWRIAPSLIFKGKGSFRTLERAHSLALALLQLSSAQTRERHFARREVPQLGHQLSTLAACGLSSRLPHRQTRLRGGYLFS